MDVSLSMGPWFTKMENEILVVDQAIVALGLPHPPHYGLVVFVDDIQMTNGGAPYASAADLKQALVNWHQFVSSDWLTGNTQINNKDPADKNYSWPENSLDSLYAAATAFQWRPDKDTFRLVIHTTDDAFWDGPEPPGCDPGWQFFPPGTANQCLTKGSQHSYQDTVAALQAGAIWVDAFAAPLGGPPDPLTAITGVYRGTSKDTSMGFFTPFKGLKPIPESTGGEVWNVEDVLAGKVSLSDGINKSIVDRHCAPYPQPK